MFLINVLVTEIQSRHYLQLSSIYITTSTPVHLLHCRYILNYCMSYVHTDYTHSVRTLGTEQVECSIVSHIFQNPHQIRYSFVLLSPGPEQLVSRAFPSRCMHLRAPDLQPAGQNPSRWTQRDHSARDLPGTTACY